jgi:hypothetical protein
MPWCAAVTDHGYAPRALIVSRNVATTTGLRAYFDERGVATTVTHDFEPIPAHGRFTAVVVFPDEFSVPVAAAKIPELALRFSRAWVLVVTRHPSRFGGLPRTADLPNASRLLVFPKPVWGWALLEQALQPPPGGVRS